MYTANNQVIFEEIYDENIQPTEDEIVEYANFLGIDQKEEPELMWIARQGVMAPLPRGWKPVQDPQGELYYFNFETGESIWDHPCDQDYKKLVIEERNSLLEKGRDGYLASLSESRQASPTKIRNTLRNSDRLNGISSLKSTSTISDVLNAKLNLNKNLRSDFSMFDTKELGNVEYEEENDQGFKDEEDEKNEDEEESEPSWKKKSDSEDSSNGFQKPVDFGIDKDTSMKLDKLNVMLMVGKTKEVNASIRMSVDSMPTTSRDVGAESPTRAYVKMTTGYDDLDIKKSASFQLSESNDIKRFDSANEEKVKREPDYQRDLKLLQDSLEREFDQKRLELLENKDTRVKRLKEEIEKDLSNFNENERKRISKEQEERLKELKHNMEHELEKEQESLRKKHIEQLNSMQKEFNSDKQLRKERFSMQISKFMKSGKSFDELDETEEKRELAIYFEHIEKKYTEKLDERKRELQSRYVKKLKETEEELEYLYEDEAENKQNEVRLVKEKNLRLETFDKQMSDLLDEKMKEYKKREKTELDSLKHEYEIKIKTFKEKYKDLEDKEFKYFENEFNKVKEKLQLDYSMKTKDLEEELKINYDRLKREEEDLKKRLDIIEERRTAFNKEWNDLNEKEKLIDERKDSIKNKSISIEKQNDDIMQTKYELERLKIEKHDIETKFQATQKLLDKFYRSNNFTIINKDSNLNHNENNNQSNDSYEDEEDESSSHHLKKNIIEKELLFHNNYLDDDNDDNDMKELMKHAKQKLKLKLYDAKKNAGYSNDSAHHTNSNSSISSENNNLRENIIVSSTSNEDSEEEDDKFKKKNEFVFSYQQLNQHTLNSDLNRHKMYLIENLNKEKDGLQVANQLLLKYKQSLGKRKLMLDSAKQEIKSEEKYQTKTLNPTEQNKLENKKVLLDKEEIDLKQLLVNIRSTKRLLKQKKAQLNLLESSVLDQNIKDNSLSSDTDLSQNDDLNHYFKQDNKSMRTITNSLSSNTNLNQINDDSNLNELITKLKHLHSSGELADSSIRSLQPILQTLPKLNSKLKETFRNLSKYSVKSSFDLHETTETASALNFINEKWQKYLNSTSNNNLDKNIPSSQLLFSNNNKQLMKTLENVVATSNEIRQLGAWENSPAYHKLTFESGTKVLDEKWDKYIGDNPQVLTQKKKNSSSAQPNKYLSSSLVLTSNSINKSNALPMATQQRLNQHRDWLKKFKAETDYKQNHFKF